ncbi:hypothetical protein AO203_04275 [Lactobacillus gallinarum]|nr:hypothetical protein AO203_04275 [Lactobacillus gallinarum]
MTKSKIISFINMKGGVGKTTLCINVADYLANKDNKVLILDMDPQFNATQALLLEQQRRNRGENENNLDKESTDKKEDEAVKAEIDSSKYYKNLSTRGKTILQIFKSTNPNDDKKSIILHFTDNIDFIPGDLDLSSVVAGDTAGKVGAIKQYIYNNDLNEHYDYILIDCPPTWSILTHASLYASNYYIIPSKIDFYSSIGIKSLQDKIKEKLLNEFSYREVAQATGESIENLGVIFSMTTNLKAESSIKETVKKDIGKNIPIFDAEIPFIRSAASSFIFYSEVEDNTTYANLTNSFDQFMSLLLDKMK